MRKKWIEYFGMYGLEINLGEDLLIAEIFKEENDWYLDSRLMGVYDEYLAVDNLRQAKEEVERSIIEYLECEIDYNKGLLDAVTNREG